MQHAAPPSPCPASPDDPHVDRTGRTLPARTIPARIAALLHTVRIMLGFGRHLAATVQHRSVSPGFNVIAACFGTRRLYAILAHLERGILRAKALEHVLLARAARGRDIRFAVPGERASAAPTAPAAPADALIDPAATQTVAAPVARKPRPSRPVGWDDPELFM